MLQEFGKPLLNIPPLYMAMANIPIYVLYVQFYFAARHLLNIKPRAKLACVICKMPILVSLATVHLPRIGYNTPSFNWYGTERLVRKYLVSKGIETSMYPYLS